MTNSENERHRQSGDRHYDFNCAPGWGVCLPSDTAEKLNQDIDRLMRKGVEYSLKSARRVRDIFRQRRK